VLERHLATTLPPQAAADVTQALVNGAARGWSQAKMRREATQSLALTHTRATTILRTESMRSYRAAAGETFQANTHTLAGWVWTSALDRRTCVACAVMNGTLHSADETLDGHPRCRCAMVPRTKSWRELGVDLPDDRPAVASGIDWVNAQPVPVQQAIMGPRKYAAWKAGEVTLEDMVARHHDRDWGTMRTERSLKSIRAGRHANPPLVTP
jgi:SPP1 gp7 family putative phage head morphogenesis protein